MSPSLHPLRSKPKVPDHRLADAPDFAKAMVEQALAPVVADLDELNQRIMSYVPAKTMSARSVSAHILGSGGKRIRPALFFMSCHLLEYHGEHYYQIAAVTEFVHTASLLHDDVVDTSSLRRGKPTANSIYGDATSVLVGDLIYSTASELMAATGNMEIVRTFARAIRLMSDGELLQLENLFNPLVDEEVYLHILEYKTATLIEAACKSAGLLAGVAQSRWEALGRFGHEVGMAFQLIDDALDYTGSAELVGKATLSDLPDGKVTLPVILLRNLATSQELQRLAHLLQGKVDLAATREVAALVTKYNTAELTVQRAQGYTMRAMEALHSFPPSTARGHLENLANKLLFRFK